MNTDLTDITINLDTSQIEKSMHEMTSIIKEALNEINNSIATFNESGSSLGNTVANVSGIVGGFSSALTLLANEGNVLGKVTKNLGSIFNALTNPIGLATLAISGIVGAVGFLCGSIDVENAKHQETMNAINVEITSRNNLQAKQQEQASANLAEANNVNALGQELKTLVSKNNEVTDANKDRASFITSVLNEALGTQMEVEGNVIKGYDQAKDAIENKLAKLKAEAILEAQLPAYKEAIINSTNAQIEANRLEGEMSDLNMQKKAKVAQLEAKYGEMWMFEAKSIRLEHRCVPIYSLKALLEGAYTQGIGKGLSRKYIRGEPILIY